MPLTRENANRRPLSEAAAAPSGLRRRAKPLVGFFSRSPKSARLTTIPKIRAESSPKSMFSTMLGSIRRPGRLDRPKRGSSRETVTQVGSIDRDRWASCESPRSFAAIRISPGPRAHGKGRMTKTIMRPFRTTCIFAREASGEHPRRSLRAPSRSARRASRERHRAPHDANIPRKRLRRTASPVTSGKKPRFRARPRLRLPS